MGPSSALSPQIDSHQLAALIKQRAREIGFDLVGITSAEPSSYRDYMRAWVDGGRAASMNYLVERFDERTDPCTYFPGAASVICLAMHYHVPLEPLPPGDAESHGRIARYALGDDYHQHIKDRLHDLADWLRELVPGARTKSGVDTVPVMEKELAARAGIGWIGKNTCLINVDTGSWMLLGEVLTTLDLPHDDPAIDRCGTCTRCLDACPTGAITAPYQLDARRCISYLTIEHRADDISPELRKGMGNWLYGCDICQDVCPWNRQPATATNAAFTPRLKTGTLNVREILGWSQAEYRDAVRGTAMKRVKLPVLQRNARIALNNLENS